MAIPTIIASNQTAGPIVLTRLGLTVPSSSSLQLDLWAYVDEILQDESLYAAIVAGNILLDLGSGELTQGDSIKFFNIVSQEVRISVTAVETSANRALTGSATVDDIVLATGERVLLTAQTNAAQNGVWVINTGGAWARPEDYDAGQSAAGGLFYIQEGTTNAGTLYNCDTVSGSDVIGTNDLAFSQVSGGGGGGDSLQTAYDAGNTITTASSTDIAFTLASGDFTVDGAGNVVFGGGTSLGDFSVDTGTMSLDSTDTTNLSMTANDAGDKALTLAATNAGAGDGLIAISADGEVDLDAGAALSLNSSGGAINIGDDAVAQPINVGTGAAARTITVGNATGATAVDVNTGTGGFDLNSLGTIEMDGVGASNLTIDSGNLTLSTTTSGGILVDSAGVADMQAVGAVTIDSSGAAIGIGTDDDDFAINVGTNGERQITIGNNTGVTGVAIETGSGNLLIDAPVTTLTGNLTVQGKTTTVESEIVNIADQFLYLNDGYETPGSARDGGTVVNVNPLATNDAVAAGGFVPAATAIAPIAGTVSGGVGTTTLTGVGTSFDTELKVGWTIVIDPGGGNEETHVIASITDADTLDVVANLANNHAGVNVNLSASNAYVTTAGSATFAAGDYIQVKGATDQTNDGLYEVLSHVGTKLVIKGIGVTAPVYDFVQNDFAEDTTVTGTIRKIEVGVDRINSSGEPDFFYGGDSSVSFSSYVLAGDLTLQGAYDGGQTITTVGGNPVLIAGSEELQVTATGGINLDTVFDADVTVFDVLMTGNNGFSIDGTADSNMTVTNTVATTDATLELTAANTGATSGDATVDINATSTNGSGIVDIDADDQVAIDAASGGAVDIGTDAVAQTVTVGNNTGATGVVIDSGTEMVEIDGVTYYGNSAGAPTATGSGFQDGDKYYDTNLDMEMRYDSTRAKFLSIEAMFIQFGRNGNTAAEQYYRGIDGRVMSTTLGYYAPHAGTVVGIGYTRSDTDAATFEIVEDGAATGAELASAAVAGGVNNFNSDFSAGGILAVRNKTGSSTISDVMGWVKVKWQITP